MSVIVPVKAPSLFAFFMAAVVSVLLLLLARVLFACLRLWSCPLSAQEKDSSLLSLQWRRSLQWNTLPVALPFSLSRPEKPSPEAANTVTSSLSQKRLQMLPVIHWQPRTRPQFQPPPPALYESPVPLSMAKMIMSRHTFRRPNFNRPRRSSSATSSKPTSPPQTPSRLYHSIA